MCPPLQPRRGKLLISLCRKRLQINTGGQGPGTSNQVEAVMIRKFGFPAAVLGVVLALAAPIASFARDRNDNGRVNDRSSYNASYYDNDRVQYDQHAQQVWNVQRDVRERQDWERNDSQRMQGIRSRGPFSNRYAVEHDWR
jgi:hypothetical protein